VGWHLGHVAFVEAQWILGHLAHQPDPLPVHYRRLFAADGLPKAARQQLPPLETILAHLAEVRSQVLTYLATAPIQTQQWLWEWLLQHESQHGETISIVLALHRQPRPGLDVAPSPSHSTPVPMVYLPPTEVCLGADHAPALDNERPAHRQTVAGFWLDVHPVTCAAYGDFMAAGGYQRPEYWSAAGWAWRQQTGISQPLYWTGAAAMAQHPVCGVSWYEAEAYSRFVNKRLPIETEWERAARATPPQAKPADTAQLYPWGHDWPTAQHCNHYSPPYSHSASILGTCEVGGYQSGRSAQGCHDLLGNVWEWTGSWFEGYSGFEPFPYRGYSQAYFDGKHRVLRGGSWATAPWALRSSWRNWYTPDMRQMFAGFRCAADRPPG
jgi:iron(II)-dependent oxidoreductase